MSSRLPPLAPKDLDQDTAKLLKAVAERMGFLPNDALLMARKPGIAKALAALVGEIQQEGVLPSETKQLVALAGSTQAGCRYCVSHTRFSALRAGISQAKLAALNNWQESTAFTAAERAAIRLAVRASEVPNGVRDEDFVALKEHFSDSAITELVAVVALFGFLNRWNSTLNTEVEAICQF